MVKMDEDKKKISAFVDTLRQPMLEMHNHKSNGDPIFEDEEESEFDQKAVVFEEAKNGDAADDEGPEEEFLEKLDEENWTKFEEELKQDELRNSENSENKGDEGRDFEPKEW